MLSLKYGVQTDSLQSSVVRFQSTAAVMKEFIELNNSGLNCSWFKRVDMID